MNKLKVVLKKESSLISLIILIIIASLLYPKFLNTMNLYNIIRDVSILGMLSIGMSMIIISGGIDLSVGSLFAVASVTVSTLSQFMSAPVAILITLIVCAVFGFTMGGLIAKAKIEPFIVTLAGLMLGRGLSYIISNETAVKIPKENMSFFASFSQRDFLGLPITFIIFIIIAIILSIVVEKTHFGRTIYAAGSNENGAKTMGLKIEQTKIIIYTLNSILVGISGIMMAAKLGSGQPSAGTGYELKAILSVVIGGILITGGVGKIRGSIIGILIIVIIENIFNLQGLGNFYRNVIMGSILLFIVIFQNKLKKRG